MRTILLALALSLPVFAADLDFKERFADPATRSESLARLVPGTRDWYFYRALDHQLANRDKEFREVMTEWRAAADRRENRISPEGYTILDNRALLLSYRTDPDGSVQELIRRLELTFEETRPDAQADEKLPDSIAADALAPAAFEAEAARRRSDHAWEGYSPARLFAELDKASSLSKRQQTYILSQLERVDHPAAVELLTAYYNEDPAQPVPFGKLRIESLLTLDQMAALLQRVSRLGSDARFLDRYIRLLRPEHETLPSYHREIQADYAKKLVALTRPLPPAMNAFKARALLHHLDLQRELGQFPQEDFLAYLAIPRQAHPLLIPAKQGGLPANGIEDPRFTDATGFAPIPDEPILRAYLDRFLANAETAAPFAPFIESGLLSRLHAAARLLAGVDPARWAKVLEPADFRDLQESTTIQFAPGQPLLLGPNDPVKLSLDLKNTPELLVRIYPIDLAGYLANQQKYPDTNLDLDGLVPHRETNLTFKQAPLLRHRETLDLPDLTGRGMWVVEAVSRGVAARALITKGRLVPYVEPSAGSLAIRVFNEAGEIVPDAAVTIGSQRYAADAKGLVTVPGNIRQLDRKALITGGGLAVLETLLISPSKPSLAALFHVDREQLIANEQATLGLNLQLTDHGTELPLSQLSDLSLTLSAALADGSTIERVISDSLKPQAEQTVGFLVPPNANSLRLSLSAKAPVATGGPAVALSAEKIFAINDTLATDVVASPFFSVTTRGYRLDLRGRNGEPLSSRAFSLEAWHADYQDSVVLSLRTDQAGHVELGTLPGITRIVVSGTNIPKAPWSPAESTTSTLIPEMLAISTRDTPRLPLNTPADKIERKRFGLLKLVDAEPAWDFFDHLGLEGGRLTIKSLPAGHYQLWIDDHTVPITVSDAVDYEGLLVSPAEIRPKQLPALPAITRTETQNGNLIVHLDAATPDTRVSLMGLRFVHHAHGIEDFQPSIRPTAKSAFFPCAYLTDRHLDDEMRYILDRRTAKAFPGSMLPRPGRLVNRWIDGDAIQKASEARLGTDGKDGHGTGYGSGNGPGLQKQKREQEVVPPLSTSVDFLAHPSVLRYSLEPDGRGIVTIPLKDFADSQLIEATVTDHGVVGKRVIPLAPSEPALRDLRLTRALDSSKHHIITRGNTALTKDDETTIDNALDADWRAFTTLEDAWSYLAGATLEDGRVSNFAFLTRWPELNEERKLELLSSHACHELHLFIARKDRPFFDKYVKAQLAEKTEPKFIDDYLLQRDLSRYLRPYAWARLNAAEKALLAQALPDVSARILTELKHRWELEAPSAEEENELFSSTLGGQGLFLQDSLGLARADLDTEAASLAKARMEESLRRIIIPAIDLDDVSVEDAMNTLSRLSAAPDSKPGARGMNFVIRRPNLSDGSVSELPRIRSLHLRNVPLAVALKYICDATRLRYKIDENAIVLSPQTEVEQDTFTRTFRVLPDFASALSSGGSGDGPVDPFAAAPASPKKHALTARPPIQEILKQAGIQFPAGSSAMLSADGTLIVTGTPQELDKIEQLTETTRSKKPSKGRSPEITSGLPDPDYSPPELPNSVGSSNSPAPSAFPVTPATPAAYSTERRADPPPALDRDQTRIWKESFYYKHSSDTGESLIPLNRFWMDLAAWDGKSAFISPHFNACINNANEALMALALLDLPFKAEKPQVKVEGTRLKVKARAAMLLFFKDTRETSRMAPDSPVLLRQTLSRMDDRERTENGRKMENSVTGDLVTGVPYALSLVISNPTGNERRVDLLAQIPAGSIPLSNLPTTLGKTLTLKPYGVENLELQFYFPVAGSFPLYPLHVSEGDIILAHTAARSLKVTSRPAAEDAASWPVIARDGTGDAILEHLRRDNLYDLDLERILWRLNDRAYYLLVSSILRERFFFSPFVSSYGFLHRDPASIREFLENSETTEQVGMWLDSPLLQVNPAEHLDRILLEFDPLVNPRAHRLADKPRLTHPVALDNYDLTLESLGWKATLSDQDQLELTFWLMLQDRTEEALARFAKVDPAKLAGRLAYDYLNAVLLFAREKPAEAKAIALKYTRHPLTLWRERFTAVIDQADEIAMLASQRPPADLTTARIAPSLEISSSPDGSLQLKHHDLQRVSLQLFHVDLEVLFSKDPFLSGGATTLPPIRANEALEIPLTAANGETRVELPEAFRHGNVLVAADAGTKRVLQVLDSRAIEILRLPAERVVQTLDASGKPLPKAYVKVYTESKDGKVTFLKDGYTDLRGKFDYLTQMVAPDAQPKRVALLIIHPQAGAKTLVFEP